MTRFSTYAVALLLVLSVVPGAATALSDGDGIAGAGEHVACGGGSSWSPAGSGYTDGSNETTRVVIRFAENASRSCIASAVSAVDGEILGGEDIDIVPVAVAEVDPEAMAALRARPDIRSVERDRIGRAAGFGDSAVGASTDTATDGDSESEAGNETVTGDASAVGSASAQGVPWGIDRINATRAASKVPDASMRDVQVAVMDSGIDLDHPDLADNLVWGTDHIDGNHRDGLQYTDDVYGHGTHVAGTIAARDNGEGVVGVAPNVELYSVRVLNDSGEGYYSWWIAGIDRAVKGPDGRLGTADDPEVISISLGGPIPAQSLEDAVERASDHAILVAAAGNSGDGNPTSNEVEYPAKYPETITVASTDASDSTVPSSAEGEEVDIAAPGYRITSTTDPSHANGYSYAIKSGTSMATPHVSGVAALVIAQDLADGARDRSNAAVEQRLYDNATDIHGPGEDRYSGHGRLGGAASLGSATGDPPTAAFDLSPTSPFVGQSVTLDASASADDLGVETYDWDIGGSSVNTVNPTTQTTIRQSGDIDVTLTVTDADGQTDSTTKTVTVQSNAPPTAAFDVSPLSPYNGEMIEFNASNSTDDHGIASYEWSIDNRSISGNGPVYTMSSLGAGTYDVTLTVADAVGLSDSITRSVTVRSNDPPTASFSVSPQPPRPGSPLTLNASNSTDDRGIARYEWTVDGQRINATDPVRTVAALPAGTHDVTLTVVDRGNRTDSTTRTITVPAALSLSNGSLVSPILVGETTPVRTAVTVTDLVPNDTVDGTLSVAASLNGSVAATTNATVQDGERTTLSVPVTPSTPGTYTVTVDGTLSMNGSTFSVQGDSLRLAVRPAGESVVPAVVGTASPTDVDGDLLLEDIDGDGNATRADVLAYYEHRGTAAIRDNPDRFDFDGDGVAGQVSDALALYEEVA